MTESKGINLAGETDLEKLLSSIAATVLNGDYVFCTLKNAGYGDHKELEPLATFTEAEGLTVIILKNRADEYGLRYESVFKCITLTVHSSLDAVGLTAAVSAKLARHGISANVIAAYHHDHIFIQAERTEQALAALSELAHQYHRCR